MTESQFADDVAVYAATREMLEEVVGELVRTAADWGLTVSLHGEDQTAHNGEAAEA